MQILLNKIKKTFFFFLPLLAFTVLIFWPSFNLHLTGDDYLGFWRYTSYMNGTHGGHWNNFNFFLTDYGPQDTITAIIHNFFGFNPTPYYIASFLFRLFAAISFYPLIKYVTKNRLAAYGTSIFFASCTTGLETTDWSFNMPSYIAIGLLNFFLLSLLSSIDKRSWKLTILSFLLFYFSIIAQPIRMVGIIPIATITLLLKTIQNYSFLNLKENLLRFVTFIFIAVIIFITGYIGNSIGAGETFQSRVLEGGWHTVVSNNFSTLRPLLQKNHYEYLIYPVAQIGSIFIPDNIVPFQHHLFNETNIIFFYNVPLLSFFLIIVFIIQKKILHFKNKIFLLSALLGLFWSTLVWFVFFLNAPYPLSPVNFFHMLIGGYLLFFILLCFIYSIKDSSITLGLFLGILILIIPFMTPWLRNPTYIYESTGRYLIISAAGLSIIIGIMLKLAVKNNYSLTFLLLIICLFTIHAKSSFSYLYHLSTVRGITMTNNIRQSVSNVNGFGLSEPLVFYFQAENPEVLHHSLLFGFPVIMGAQYHFFNVWNVMYTDNWQEIESAYRDGLSLRRFSIPIKKVSLNYIYSFKLDGDHLINTSYDTRQKIQSEHNN